MPEAFSLREALPAESGESAKPRRVLVTGAAGRIGSYFSNHAPDRYDLRLMVRPGDDRASIEGKGEIVECELADLEGLKRACAGIDTVLHLAGNPDFKATWDELWEPNVLGLYNAMAAAKAAGCRRFVFASSIHAIEGYPADVQAREDDPPIPGDLYGVTKAFGEALGRYMAAREGLDVISVRIGAFQPVEKATSGEFVNALDVYVSERDLTQLFVRIIDDERVRSAVVHGLSENAFKRMSLHHARTLFGYAPEDDAAAPLREAGLQSPRERAGEEGDSGLRAQTGVEKMTPPAKDE